MAFDLFDQERAEHFDMVDSRLDSVSVDVDQVIHASRLIDEHRLRRPRNHVKEVGSVDRVPDDGTHIGGVDEADDVETVAATLLGVRTSAVEPRVQLAGDQRESTGDWDGDRESITSHRPPRGERRGEPMPDDEQPLLITQFIEPSRFDRRIIDWNDLELDAGNGATMRLIARDSERDQRLGRSRRRGCVDVERGPVGLAEMGPDCEPTHDGPTPSGRCDRSEGFDKRSVHRWEHEVVYCHTTLLA